MIAKIPRPEAPSPQENVLAGSTLFSKGDRVRAPMGKGGPIGMGTVEYIHGGSKPEWVTATVLFDSGERWHVALEGAEKL